jgi:hypothetical protein
MFANSQLMGMDLAFPDVCLTPMPVPTPSPYPDMAFGPTAIPVCWNILYQCVPAHNMVATVTPITLGDTPGVALGVASGTVMGPSRHITGAFTMLLKGLPASRLTSLSLQNSTNMVGMRIVPSQLKILVLAA